MTLYVGVCAITLRPLTDTGAVWNPGRRVADHRLKSRGCPLRQEAISVSEEEEERRKYWTKFYAKPKALVASLELRVKFD